MAVDATRKWTWEGTLSGTTTKVLQFTGATLLDVEIYQTGTVDLYVTHGTGDDTAIDDPASSVDGVEVATDGVPLYLWGLLQESFDRVIKLKGNGNVVRVTCRPRGV
jgi:hypothetical protein